MNVRPTWTEAELDEAMETLERTLAADAGALARIRSRVLAATAGPPARTRRRTVRWAGLAAGLAAILVGGLVLTVVGASQPPPVYAETVRTLNGAATLADHAQDPQVGPGQYLYVATHAWWRGEAMRFVYLEENLIETWVPSDRTQEWLERRKLTGRRQWLSGNEKDARAAGVLDQPSWPDGDQRARCGRFGQDPVDKDGGRAGPCGAGGWQEPTAAFLASLPRDPAALYARLRADTKGHGRDPDAEVLVYAADALRTGLVPADVRAALYRALAHLPGLKVVDHQANLDGRRGVALAITGDDETQQIIIDPATGQFIGERSVDDHGRPADFTSVTTAVATTIGVRPT
ncbi:MAG: CU044_5270 family protein [Mycobacteriales bacterium]